MKSDFLTYNLLISQTCEINQKTRKHLYINELNVF